jgi:hypothetical protein
MSDQPVTQVSLVAALNEYHRTMFIPDLQRILDEALGEVADFRREYRAGFDEMNRRLDRLEQRIPGTDTPVRRTSADPI